MQPSDDQLDTLSIAVAELTFYQTGSIGCKSQQVMAPEALSPLFSWCQNSK